MGRVKFAFLFCCVDGELLEKIFVNSTDQVFFFTKPLVADFVDFIHNLLDVVGRKVAGGERTLDKTALQLLRTGSNAVQCGIQSHIQAGSRGVDDGAPARFRGKAVCAVIKGGVIKESYLDFFCIGVESLFGKFFAQPFNAVLVFLADKAQEHEG